MPAFLTIDDLELAGRRVLLRSDLNVPMEDGEITDDFRLEAALGTIQTLREKRAKVIVCSHLGRPKAREAEFSLAPVTRRLSELGGFGARQAPDVVGPGVERIVSDMVAGDVVVLENTRFEPGETKNDPNLAFALSQLADLFVEDAFGSVHRAHASTVGVAERIRSAAGPLLVKEVKALGRLLETPARPYVVVLGGAKVSDKLGVIENLLPRVDSMVIGGGMCFTLLKAQGVSVGKSMVEDDQVDAVRALLDGPDGGKIALPTDLVAAAAFAEDAEHRIVPVDDIPDGWLGLDIGPATSQSFGEVIKGAASVFWNGPMGVFEWEPFRGGTEKVGQALAACNGYTVVGGGDSAAALALLGLDDQVSHLSTGGGAGLELLEGKSLPGVE
ncbi:MAG: phosphoglycerate kinase, partial [Acidimicrobiia bacterium]